MRADGTWLPFVNTPSLRPLARIRSITSAAPGCGRPRPSAPRCTSVPSTSNTTPRTRPKSSPSTTAPEHPVGAGADRDARELATALEAAKQRDQRRAAGVRGGDGCPRRLAVARGDHRVDLLGGHRQPQQQLLLGDSRSEALARAVETERLAPRQSP